MKTTFFYVSPNGKKTSLSCFSFRATKLTWVLIVVVFFLIHQSVNQGGDQELENLVTKLAILKDLLSSIEKKVNT